MAETPWELKLKTFLKKAGDDFKRAGNDVREEAQKLYSEVQDPKKQEQMRARLKEVGEWAKKTGDELAVLLDDGVKRAEVVITRASDRVRDFTTAPVAGARPDPGPTAPVPPPTMDGAEPPPAAKPPKKTVGRGAKRPGTKKRAAVKKPLGKPGEE